GSSGNTFDSNRVYLVKYSAAGSISWQRTFGNYKNSYGLSIKSTADNGNIICGQVQQTTTSGQHALLIKTDANGNFAGIDNHLAENGCYFYPNPAADITTLSLVNISNGNPVIIRLYDLYGREVKTIQATLALKGYTLDVADLPDGIYLAVIESDRQVTGRVKLVISH
ncbi:MAG: T9SS type A sorting domain-containing protein, partial [Bacteroidota bacterium]